MGLAELALELLYVRTVLTELGHIFQDEPVAEVSQHENLKRVNKLFDLTHGPTEVGTDNSGAFDLCHRKTNGKHTRHVARRVFKMRELQHSGVVKMQLIPTADMAADLLTKPLDDRTFERHRATIMNLHAQQP